jgi:hypothetical protein
MDLNILLQRFAEQSPLIIGCGVVIWQLLKMYKEEKAMLRTERVERQQEIRELINQHTQELKELNQYTRERDLETQESLHGAVTAIESIHQILNNKLRLLE